MTIKSVKAQQSSYHTPDSLYHTQTISERLSQFPTTKPLYPPAAFVSLLRMPHAPLNFFPHLRCTLWLPIPYLTTIDEAPIFPIGIAGDPTRDFYHGSIAWGAGQLVRQKLRPLPNPFRIYFNAERGQHDMDTPLLYTIPHGELSLDVSIISHLATFGLEGWGKREGWRRRYANAHRRRRTDGRGLKTPLCSRRLTGSPCWRLAEACT